MNDPVSNALQNTSLFCILYFCLSQSQSLIFLQDTLIKLDLESEVMLQWLGFLLQMERHSVRHIPVEYEYFQIQLLSRFERSLQTVTRFQSFIDGLVSEH